MTSLSKNSRNYTYKAESRKEILKSSPAAGAGYTHKPRFIEHSLFNPNRSLDCISPHFPLKRSFFGILPASACVLLSVLPRRSPLRLRQTEKQASSHKRAIYPKSNDRFGFNVKSTKSYRHTMTYTAPCCRNIMSSCCRNVACCVSCQVIMPYLLSSRCSNSMNSR